MGEKTFKFLSRCSFYISGVTIAFGVMVLTGWILHLQRLKRLIPGQVPVKANTAVCFVLIGTALWLTMRGARTRFTKVLPAVLALFASLVGLLSFLEFWRGWDFGIDQLLFTAGPDDLPGSARIALMSPISAADFFLLGIALALMNVRARWSLVLQRVCCVIAAVAALFGILDFVLDPRKTHTYIAPLTALILFLCSLAVLMTQRGGLGALLVSGTVGGELCRRLLPAGILIPMVIAWLRWNGEQLKFFSDWTGLAIMTLSSGVFLAGLTVWTATALDRMEVRRERAEESSRRLAAIVTSSNDAIISKTLDGIVTSWNPGAEAMYGYSAGEMIGQPVSRLIPAERREEFAGFLQRLSSGENIRHYETERMRKDGKNISVSVSVSPLKDEKGRIIGASTITRDISDRKLAQEQLRKASRYTRSLIEASLDPLVTISKEGKITDVNEATENATGLSRHRLIGSDFSDYFTEPQKAQEGYKKVFEKGFVRDYPLAIRSTSGAVIDVLYSATVFKGADGEVEGVFAAARDVTERKRAEERIRRINLTLQTLNACADSMMRASDESALLQQVCDAIIHFGGYRMAWVGYAQQDENKTVRPMAISGAEDGYLRTANITWADTERGRGPTGTAVRTGKVVVSADFANNPLFEPWREEAARRGYRCSIVLPLRTENEILGAISIYSGNAGAFDSREQVLLEQLASNLSYAIMAVRARAQRDRSEQKLRESGLYVRNLIEASLDPLVTISKEGKITDVNQATETATGLSRDRLIGSDFSDYFTEPQKAREGYEKVFEKGFVRDYPLAIRSASGVVTDVLYNASVFRGADGEVEGVFAAARDVTERKRAEEALHRSECRYRSLVTATAQIVWTTNREGEVVDDMPMWRAYTGMSRQQISGAGWLDSLHPDDRNQTEQVWAKAWRNRERYDTEYRIRGRDGGYRIFSARGVPVLADDGTVREWVGTCTDITERKQAEEEVRKLNNELERRVVERTAQLESANKELEAFTYSVSHDLRAPLRHISGFSKILSEEFSESLPSEAQHHVRRIQEGTRRMGQLVDDLLNLGRVGRRELTLQVAGIRSIVDEVIDGLKSEVGDRQVEWKIGDLPYVECDTALMRQVFQNLLANALKFTRPRAQAVIEIGQEQRDGVPVIFVRDNGVGFSMKYADKLFGVFQRLHRAEDFEGTGVGLATVQRIIQKHGGGIWAEAELDRGAAFYFTLSAAEAEQKAPQSTAARA